MTSLSMDPLTLGHVLITLIAIISGLVVLGQMRSNTLSGGWTGRRDTLKASYRGKFAGGAATLSGRHVISYEGKTYNRTCSMTIGR